MLPSTCIVGSAINGEHDADFREVARTKPERERHRTQTFRGRYRRSLAETRRRNLDAGFRREQGRLLFLLLGRRKGTSVGTPCARSMCAHRLRREQPPMCSTAPRDWLPIALFPDDCDLEPATSAWPDRGAAFSMPAQVGRLVQCLDRYLDAVLLASSLSKSAVKTCFAFPTCGTALAWSTLPGFPTTIIPTIPMP